MFKNCTVVFFLLLCLSAGAQKYEFGNVSVAELEQKKHPLDSSAVAAILYASCDSDIAFNRLGFTTKHTVTKRIKIYNKEGYEWANQQIIHGLGRRSETVSISEAATYNLVDGKVVKTKLKTDGKFDEKINKYIGRIKFTMPNVKEGSVLEFRYQIDYHGISTPPKWDFQENIPVDYSELKTHVPEYLQFNTNQKGSLFPKITTAKQERTGNYEETITTYVSKNLPALNQEIYVTNIRNYTSGISHEFAAYKFSGGVVLASEKLAADWPSVARNIYESDDFGDELKKRGYFEKIVDSLKLGKTSRADIISSIFNYVKSNIKWNKQMGIVCEYGLKNALKTKSGNAAEINLLLVAMLQYIEMDAWPVLVSTRTNGIALFPSITAFDHVIAGVETPMGMTLLDATGEFSSPDILPLSDLNWYGRLIRSNNTSVQVDLVPKILSKEVCRLNLSISKDGVAEGQFRRQLTDYEALSFREKNTNTVKEVYLETLENENDNIAIDNYSRENEKEASQPLSETYHFKSQTAAEVVDQRMYISPMLFLTDKENPFKQEKRECPIDFGYPVQRKYSISIQMPQGYKVESVPVSANYVTGDDVGAFRYVVGFSGDTIQITVGFDMNAAVLPADYYEVLKDFFQKMIDKQNERIVLIKAS